MEIEKKYASSLQGAWPYHEEDGRLFVHGGYDWKTPVKEQDPQGLMWDRHLFGSAYTWEKTGQSGLKQHTEVFIGHTSTSRIDPELRPVRLDRVWNLDQGAGFEGKLTLINVETKEYFQSDLVSDLYPKERGR